MSFPALRVRCALRVRSDGEAPSPAGAASGKHQRKPKRARPQADVGEAAAGSAKRPKGKAKGAAAKAATGPSKATAKASKASPKAAAGAPHQGTKTPKAAPKTGSGKKQVRFGARRS